MSVRANWFYGPVGALLRGLAIALPSIAAAGSADYKVELPPDITIVETDRGPVLATQAGMTIYKKLPNIASWGRAKKQAEVIGACVYQCPSEWPPVVPSRNARPVGDFTIVAHENGARQWAYKGVPLQTFIFDRARGHTLGDDTYAFNGPRVPIGEAAWIESPIGPQKPPEPPLPTTDLPPGITVQLGIGGSRYFADAEGMTLYSHAGDACTGPCLSDWRPLVAGALAQSVGRWTVISSTGGLRQWAFDGKAVYTYAKEKIIGETGGENGSAGWRALVEYKAPVPAEVAIGQTETGAVYVEKKSGQMLYYQGFNHRPYDSLGFNHKPYLFGTVNCHNACAAEYPPLLAPADAMPMGEWWLVTRVDGTKQWAYRGLPLHTYRDDVPGRHLAAFKAHIWTEAIANNH